MSRGRQYHRWQLDDPDDFTTTPLTISFIISGFLLLLILFCRCYMVFRKWKNRRTNGQTNTVSKSDSWDSCAHARVAGLLTVNSSSGTNEIVYVNREENSRRHRQLQWSGVTYIPPSIISRSCVTFHSSWDLILLVKISDFKVACFNRGMMTVYVVLNAFFV